MIQAVEKYATMLKELEIPEDVIEQALDIFQTVPVLMEQFCNPAADLAGKHRAIDKIFPSQIRDMIKVMCDDQDIELFPEVCKAYKETQWKKTGKERAILKYVTEPTEEQLEGIREFVKKESGSDEIELVCEKEESLGGGFVLSIGNKEYDWSTEGRIKQLTEKILGDNREGKHSQTLEGIISILQSEIEDFDLEAKDKEVGTVKSVGDGIVNIDGIDHAMYGEIVIFDNGIKGMVQDIKRDEIGCILFGSDSEIREGSRVMRTGRKAGIPVGDQFLGRVINALGAPVDGEGDIPSSDYRPIENEAPGIVDRKSVSVPLETGILSIDSMFPIGRGQRELIIGDRQTGKTSIAIDAILNQKGKDVKCIYVAIGQKASTVAKIVHTLKAHDAMEYTTVVVSTASDPAPLQYMAPYSGTALAEYFMYQGKDVLIVYDDLSKHAVAYRALSLLLERSPGREAYPGDVFYLHSRLLERSSRLNEKAGGGSITALPIIETQAGDVSAYIPTNVISITDGQIFLESDLFFSGMRPAVNVGLSVSRVGGAAQTKAMKKAAGSIRIDLAQYREMEVFTQFSSDLDPATVEQLKYGKGLMELLKQPLCKPFSMPQQVIMLCAATGKVMIDVPVEKIREFRTGMLDYFSKSQPVIVRELETTGQLSDSLRDQIVKAAEEYRDQVWNKEV
ncbi:ATP synthase subunit alpha [uncultured Clostridium sp.]|uniref:ATP synthase subunit alpha n=1 Tax=Muricoprocola aceti TaxID=2981772 RepID=A0ABT2SIL9_9FIRM|nr:F0F1 ATP synthase subunit alpha [Muricoprocola aceti]MCU6724352.1 F0F1 ATP synthase subunit alpha [Muricoprocola aceti]SCH10185.1 ATP synthase subunit alpha [uncultured Clostridium sp.]